MKVTNLVYWVADATLSVKFYKKLGFEVVEEVERHARVKLGSFEIVLVTMRDDEEFNGDSLAAEKGRGMYLYIRTDDVDSLHLHLQQIGILPHSAPRNWEWGNREFVVADPDGYKICFWAPI